MRLFSKKRCGNKRIIEIFGRKIFSYTRRDEYEIYRKLDAMNEKIECQSILLAGTLLSSWRAMPPANMRDAEFKVFSQWGEDGIIQWIIGKIPGIPESFVEFGCSNYEESNTRFLLMHNNWSGLILDSSEQHIGEIKKKEYAWRHGIKPVQAFVDRDNINELIGGNGFSGEIGILSVDIDGVDYWVLKNIECINPQVIICEFNYFFGGMDAITVPYKENFSRFDEHAGGLYFGASLKALEVMLDKKGYSLIGICSNVVNAFFVRNDLMEGGGFARKKAGDILPHACYGNAPGVNAAPAVSRDCVKQLGLMREMPVYDVLADAVRPLSQYIVEQVSDANR